MTRAIRIHYRHVLGCLPGDCPGHSALIRTAEEVREVVRRLTERHSDFPVEIEGVAEVEA